MMKERTTKHVGRSRLIVMSVGALNITIWLVCLSVMSLFFLFIRNVIPVILLVSKAFVNNLCFLNQIAIL